ncbi:MAG: flagellar hook assembly protein FlgD [Firmicutes bacterium]|nr:flagellar hook assembly protein FlgD [Bacillota bacterium]
MQVGVVNNTTSPAPAASQLGGKDDFLQLLVTQLRLQDPLEPVKEREFIAQLAQFSTLEGINNLAQELTTLVDLEQASLRQNADQAAVQMIGRQVLLTTETGEISGIVSAVRWFQGRPQIVVHGQAYDLGYIKELKPAPAEDEKADV